MHNTWNSKFTMYKQLLDGIRSAWSATGFAADEVALYAQRLTVQDARQGLMVLSVLLFALYAVEIAFHVHFGLEELHMYTLGLLGILCVHVALSSRALHDTKSIYLLGATLLMVSGTAFVLLAHQASTLSTALFASVTLLFMVIPLVPWGLREGLIVVSLIYGTFTVSTWSAPTGFDHGSLWALQFVMLSAGLISLALVTRNASVRKADIRVRFDLEKAHHKMMHLSHKDPLTGAWNRRYLNSVFDAKMTAWQLVGKTRHFALLDIDNFKPLNDSYGHDYGDMVLRCVVDGFNKVIGTEGFFVRMGGDEFAILFAADDPTSLIESGVEAIRSSRPREKSNGFFVQMSVGLVSVPPGVGISQHGAYREADIALYEAKDRKASYSGRVNLVMRTLSDQPQSRSA
jgi:diguanylate cyclase (GGDEF)-like protein